MPFRAGDERESGVAGKKGLNVVGKSEPCEYAMSGFDGFADKLVGDTAARNGFGREMGAVCSRVVSEDPSFNIVLLSSEPELLAEV